jgi:hypothetical protein
MLDEEEINEYDPFCQACGHSFDDEGGCAVCSGYDEENCPICGALFVDPLRGKECSECGWSEGMCWNCGEELNQALECPKCDSKA